MKIFNNIGQQKALAMVNKAWFLPLVICIIVNFVGLVLSVGFEMIEEITYVSISSSRQQSILTVIASSLMTLISVSFSISMLILSTVSNQFGPRLLPNILQAKQTQVTLGSFLATFIFCIFCIYFETSPHTRGAQTLGVLCLTIFCLALLVLFINHVVQSIQIDYILSLVTKNTKSAIRSNYKKSEDIESPPSPACSAQTPQHVDFIRAPKSGYIQSIDYEELQKIAESSKIQFTTFTRPGDYIYKNNKLIEVTAQQLPLNKDLDFSDIQSCITIDNTRWLKQDIEFGFEQIAEIAVRALSPGINDPYTARQCLFLLGELFLFIDNYAIEKNITNQRPDLLTSVRDFSYEGIVDAALNRVRQAALTDPTVVLAMYDMIIRVSRLLKKKNLMQALITQANALQEALKKRNLSAYDHKAYAEREKIIHELSASQDK